MSVNPVLLELFKHRFISVAEEMGVTLMRTGFSPNIKERRDFSCAVFDAQGEMIAQAAHIPVHLGSMPLSVKAAMEAGPLARGDMVVVNDPFKGGTHLPDITLVAPVFTDESGHDDLSHRPAFYVANRAHHADVGGMASGSMPLGTSLFQEGLVIPPLKLVEQGNVDEKLLTLILNNVRTPEERRGDFAAQIMANLTGAQRLHELMARHGVETMARLGNALMDHAEAAVRQAVAAIPDGVYDHEDVMEDDGVGAQNISIRLRLTVAQDQATLDFTRSDPQARGGVNAVRGIVLSAALYAFRALMPERVPANAGCLRPLDVRTKPGTVADARFPAAVAGGNVETSQRLVDVILGALAQALPQAIPAASQGTMNNITIGGDGNDGPAHNRAFAYYETLGGGMGASAHSDGESAVHSHMTNTLNTPVEALEYAYPLLATRYSIRHDSGGHGLHQGGDGLVRELELLADAEITVLSERRRTEPYGLQGGGPGATGRNVLVRNGEEEEMPGKFHAALKTGDRVRIETPGGGGWGQKGKSKE
jgi:N-methylhydantoinase B